MASQSNAEPVWKQEVNRRLAEHNNRKGPCIVDKKTSAQPHLAPNSRAAQAAARVAARYAKAPSYSQMQAAEALSAVREAEVATKAALAAQAKAKAALEAAAGQESFHEEEETVAAAPVESAETERTESPDDWVDCVEDEQPGEPILTVQAEPQHRPLEVRWEPDMPVRAVEQALPRAVRNAEPPEHWHFVEPNDLEPGYAETRENASAAGEVPRTVEPDLPIHANLIEFPRELVAARKVRPRLAEGSFAAPEPSGQLSIFEVDPSTISTEPEPAPIAAAPQPQPCEWSGIQLDSRPEEEIELEPDPVAPPATVHLAPLNRRLLAAFVDGTLVSGAFLLAAWGAASRMDHLPETRLLEIGAGVGLLAIGLLYQMLFSSFAEGTPGMKYAGISLCTFDDQIPTRAQRCGRFGALVLSVLPVGLGLAWSVFDEDHLSWHDRLSKTYQRKC